MAAISTAALTFSGTSSSDNLRSSSNGVCGVPLKSLVKARLGFGRKRDFTVSAAIIKGKNYEYPWPDNADPNVKGGILYHLSHFKTLNKKPKPVTLDFEKPLIALEKKIMDVRKMASETGLDFSDQIASLENKYHKALKDLYTHLTPIQRVNIARHPNRPTFLDHIFNITEKFVELHGDRQGYDDPAIVTGIGTIDGKRYMFIGHQKGRNTKENIQRNFGMPTPHGYRKALRMMYYAEHHGFPIVTFIDTPGAFADLKSEELGQGEAIAHNLRTMFGLKVPIVSIVIGEGGSGGALAIGCANKLLMLENAVFYVASPEACAAILWKTAKAAPKAAEKLKITATELCKLQIADGVVPEPLGGAHADSAWTSMQLKIAINEAMDELNKMDTEELLKHRMLKFRKIGGFQEGIAIDPKRKINMKAKEDPIYSKSTEIELEGEIEKLKQRIVKAGESSAKPPMLDMNELIKKLKKEVDLEYSEAVEALGLKDRLQALRDEFQKAKESKDQVVAMALKDKVEKLKNELDQNISTAPNYATLTNKLKMLKEMSNAKNLAEKNQKAITLKQEINKKFKEVLNRPDLQEKIDKLKAETENGELDDAVKEKIINVKKEIEMELAGTLKSLNLDVEVQEKRGNKHLTDFKGKVEEFNEEISNKIANVVGSSDLKKKIDLLKIAIAKAGKTPDTKSKEKIEALAQQIKLELAEAIDVSELKEKLEKLELEISGATESSEEDITDDSRVENNWAASRSYV